MNKEELIDNLKRIKKDFIRDNKELNKKYYELVSEANKNFLKTNSKYKEDDIILVNKNEKNEFYKVINVMSSHSLYYLENIESFGYFFNDRTKLEERNTYITYSCKKLQKSGTIGKTYYTIFDSFNNHFKVGESKDYDTPSKIRKLFKMQFDSILYL